MSSVTIFKDQGFTHSTCCSYRYILNNTSASENGRTGVSRDTMQIRHGYDVTLPPGRINIPVKKVNTQAIYDIKKGAIESMNFSCSLRNATSSNNNLYTLLLKQGDNVYVSKRAFCVAEATWISCSVQQLVASDFLHLASIQPECCVLADGPVYPNFSSASSGELTFGYAMVCDSSAPVDSNVLSLADWELFVFHENVNSAVVPVDQCQRISQLEYNLVTSQQALCEESHQRSRLEDQVRKLRRNHARQRQQLVEEAQCKEFAHRDLQQKHDALVEAQAECEHLRRVNNELQQQSIDKSYGIVDGAHIDGIAQEMEKLRCELVDTKRQLEEESSKRKDVEEMAKHEYEHRNRLEQHQQLSQSKMQASVKNLLDQKNEELNEERNHRASLEALLSVESKGWQLVDSNGILASINLVTGDTNGESATIVSAELFATLREEIERERRMRETADAAFATSEAELERVRTEHETLHSRHAAQSLVLKQLEASIENLRKEHEDLCDSHKRACAHVVALEKALTTSEEAQRDAERARKAAEVELESLKAEISALEKFVVSLREEVQHETKAREVAELTCKESAAECACSRAQCEQLLEQLRQALEETRKVREDAAIQCDNLRAEAVNVTASVAEEVRGKVDELHATITSLRNDLEKTNEELVKERTAKKAVEAARDDALVEIDSKNKFASRLQHNTQLVIRASEGLRNDVENLQNALQDARNKETEMRKRLADAERLVTLVSAIRREVEIERNARAKAELELNRFKRLAANGMEEDDWHVVSGNH